MQLTPEQLKQFDEEGWVFLPDVFSQDEIDVLTGELPGIFSMDRPEVWRETGSDSVRTAFAAQYYNEAYRRLGAHPRLIGPVMQLFNGPLYIIPRSHKGGVIEAGHDTLTTSYPLWTLDKETVARLAEEGGMIAPKGKPGSVLLFHSNIVHASAPNISPWGRVIVYLSLCHVDNHITQFKREEWIAHRNFTPIEALDDDCLMELAKENAAAAE